MCELTTGHTKQFCPSIGGTKAVVIYNIQNRDSYTEASGAISAISMIASKTAFRIAPDMASIEVKETITPNRENNTLFYAQSCSVILKDDTPETRELIDLMAKGFLGVIQEKENGNNLHYGIENGMTLVPSEIVTGKAFEDLNGVTISLVGKEKAIAPSIDNALIAGIL